MSRLTVALAVAVAALVAAGSAMSSASATKLTGTVGPGFTITLKKGSAKVKTLKPGKYQIVVRDKSADHDFHLKGPGVNKFITKTPFVGTKTVTVRLQAGRYRYYAATQGSMRHTFSVR